MFNSLTLRELWWTVGIGTGIISSRYSHYAMTTLQTVGLAIRHLCNFTSIPFVHCTLHILKLWVYLHDDLCHVYICRGCSLPKHTADSSKHSAVSRRSKWIHSSQSSAEVKTIPAVGLGPLEYQTFLETV